MKAISKILFVIMAVCAWTGLEASGPAAEPVTQMTEDERFAFYDAIDEALDHSNAQLSVIQAQMYGEVLHQSTYLEFQMAQQSHEVKLALAGKFRNSSLMNDPSKREAFLELMNRDVIDLEDLSDFQKIL